MDLGPKHGAESRAILDQELAWLDALLTDGRPYLTGLTWTDPAFISTAGYPGGAECYAGSTENRGFAVRINVKPGQSADLLITLGPLPVADQVVFAVTEKYDDGTSVVNDVVPAPGASAPHGAAVLRLIPDTISDQNGGGHHGGTATDTQPVANVTDDSSNTGLWLGIAGLVAGLAGGAVIAWLAASRRKPAAPASPVDTTPTPQKSDEPDSVWRYRGDEDPADDAPKVRAAAGKTS